MKPAPADPAKRAIIKGNSMNKISTALLGAALLVAGAAQAATNPVVVNAADVAGSDAGWLVAGQSFTVTVDANDLWSAGEIPRFSNADGLTHDLVATGTDESGAAAGTLIGKNWGLYGNFAYGELVGQIGNGSIFGVGTNFSGVAATTGELRLFYWDSGYSDNFGSITANVTAVPEPTNLALIGLGLGAFALSRRRKA